MKKEDVAQLPVGLYVIHWKEGGISLAAVGMGQDGDRWLAPTNWQAPAQGQKAWRMVEKAERVGVMLNSRDSLYQLLPPPKQPA